MISIASPTDIQIAEAKIRELSNMLDSQTQRANNFHMENEKLKFKIDHYKTIIEEARTEWGRGKKDLNVVISELVLSAKQL